MSDVGDKDYHSDGKADRPDSDTKVEPKGYALDPFRVLLIHLDR